MIISRFWDHLILVVFALLVIGCEAEPIGSSDLQSPSASSGSDNVMNEPEPTSLPEIRGGSPEEIVQQFIEACEIGDVVTAVEFVRPDMRDGVNAYNGGDPCIHNPDNMGSGSLYDSRSAGATEIVEWEWVEPDLKVRSQFKLSEEDGGWFIFDSSELLREETERQIRPGTENIEPDAPIYIADDSLAADIAYVEIPAVMGRKAITTEMVIVDGDWAGREENIVGEQFVQEPVAAVIRYGTKPVEDVWDEVTGMANDYLSYLQNGEYGKAVEITNELSLNGRDVVGVADDIDFALTSYSIGDQWSLEKGSMEGFQQSGRIAPFRDSLLFRPLEEYEHNPYPSPLYSFATFPIQIEYSLFGVPKEFSGNLMLVQSPTESWSVLNWMFFAGGRSGNSVAIEEFSVRLEGVAVASHGTTIQVITEGANPPLIPNQNQAAIRVEGVDGKREQSDRLKTLIQVDEGQQLFDIHFPHVPNDVTAFRLDMKLRRNRMAGWYEFGFDVNLE